MENINIAEILKDCPRGTKLYSPIFGDVYLNKIRPNLAIVVTTDKEQCDNTEEFLYDGRYGMNGECMLFPSKDQRDWNKFHIPFKDNGYKWNDETKTLEKLIQPRFKVGDIIQPKIDNYDKFTITNIDKYFYRDCSEKGEFLIPIEKQDNWELVSDEIKPKFKVGDKIKRKNTNEEHTITEVTESTYEYSITKYCDGYITIKSQDDWKLVPEKFDITTLVPFETKVLVRDSESQIWRPAIWGYYAENCGNYLHGVVGGSCWKYCIPYEGNEHLRGKTEDCEEFYKTWKD